MRERQPLLPTVPVRVADEPRVTLSPSLLRRFIECERKPFMDAFAKPAMAVCPPAQRLPDVDEPSSERDDNEPLNVVRLQPDSSPPAGVDRFAWTEQRMVNGAPRIDRGTIRHGPWIAQPEWLERSSGASRFGVWSYVPGSWRWRVKDSLRYLAVPQTFTALLLERVQGTRPSNFIIESPMTGTREVRSVVDHLEDTEHTIARLRSMLATRRDPGPRLKGDCATCRWQSACHDDAVRSHHISLLPGLPPTALAKLAAIGIDDLPAFAKAEPLRLRSIPGFRDPRTLLRAQAQATAYITGEVAVVGIPALPPRAGRELFLDFEADPITREPFLAGVMIRTGKRTKYRPFMAQSANGVGRMSREFLRLLAKESLGASVYHYGPFEARVLRGLPATRNIDLGVLEQRLVDVLPFVREHAGIPSKTFALKEVARVLGISLPASDLDGRSAPSWWEAWVRTRKASLHRRLLAYNKMDLVALAGVLDWLRGDYVLPNALE